MPKDVLPLVHLLLLVTEAHSLIYFVAFTFILGLCLEEYIFFEQFHCCLFCEISTYELIQISNI